LSQKELEILSRIARAAGDGIMRIYSGAFQVDYKEPGDPVTDADREANTLICEQLLVHFPDAAIVAEESPSQSYTGYREHSRVFFVDPLDGTREFVARNGQFVVMIGLLVDDQPTLGVVYAPVTGTLWYGAPDLGAHRVERDGTQREIRVSDVASPEAACLAVSRSRRSERLKHVLRRVAPRQVVPMGSAGLKGAQVADGAADAYLALGPAGKYWDACAVEALVTAAGGRVTDACGRRLHYRSHLLELDEGLLAANVALHDALLARLGSATS